MIWVSGVAQSLKIDDLLKNLENNNLDIKSLELLIASNEQMIASNKELPKAMVDLQYGNIQNPFVSDYTLGISQSFLNPNYYKANKELLIKYKEEKTVLKLLLTNELKRQIKDLYYLYQLNIQNKKLINNQKSTIENALEIAKLRLELGENDKLTLLNLKLELFNLDKQFDKLGIQNQRISNSIAALCKLDTPVNLFEIEYFDLKKYENLNGQNFELNSLDASINIKNYEINLEKSKLKPDFKIGLINQSMLGSFRQFIVLGGIDIPLNKRPQKAKIKAFEIEKTAIENKFNSLENKIRLEKISILNDLASKKSEIEKFNTELQPLLNEIADKTMKRYKNSEVDFIIIQNQLFQNFQSKVSVLNSIHEYNILINQLEFLNGK